MISYMRADLRRIYRRIPRLIALALLFVAVTVVFVGIGKEDARLSTMMIIFEHYIVGFIPLVIGVIEMAVVFADDFHARTMQQAIGRGVSRLSVVLCKLLDLAVLMLVDIAVFGALILAANGLWQIGMTGGVMAEFILTLLSAWIKSVGYASLSMILAFYSQNALFSLLLYIALSSGAAGKLLDMALGMKALAPLHLGRFLLTAEANAFYTRALLGSFNIGALVAVLVYVAAGVAVSTYLFKSTELEL